MNLADMVAQICSDTGYVDADDQAFARTALRQRDDLLWRMGLWKDSLVQVNVSLDPVTNQDHAEGVIYLPEVIERVVAVRTADQSLRVSGLETFYRVDFDTFSQTGSPVQFAKLSPAWFAWRGSPGLALVCAAAELPVVRVIWSDRSGARYTTQGAADVVGTFLLTDPDPDRSSVIVSGAVTYPDANGTYVLTANQNGFPTWTKGDWFIRHNAVLNPLASSWFIFESGPSGGSRYHSATGVQLWPDLSPTWTPAFGSPEALVRGNLSKLTIEEIFKPKTLGAVALNPQTAGDPDGGTLALGATRSPKHQRIRVFPMPTAAGAVKVLGKAAYIPLDFDQQEPLITGSHLALMAFAKHLLLKRGGENGTAVDAIQEATALLDTLKKEELLQEANNSRIIPDAGYGDAYFGPGGFIG